MLKKMISLKEKTILVLGGAGFIGTNFIRQISAEHKKIKIINFDKLTYAGLNSKPENLNQKTDYVFIRGDIARKSDLEKIFKKYQPEYVVNFAAETHVDRSIHGGAKEFVKTNIEGVFNILELVKKNSFVKKFLQVSTDEVYGSLPLFGKYKFKETDPLLPNSPYAASKAAGDLLCRSYFSTWGVQVVISRSSNNFGPFQYPEKAIPYFASLALAGKNLPLYGDGKNTRDWISVYDNCWALELCLLWGKPGEIYNISSGAEKTNLEIAMALLQYFKLPLSKISFVSDRPGHDQKYALDSSKIRREFGWKPKYGFLRAFRDTLEWYSLPGNYWLKQINSVSLNKHIKKT